MSRHPRPKFCIYCGGTKNITKDHIPPKGLFAVKPSNPITVPSCRDCNNGAAKDDEYFRLVIAARHDAGDHPDANQLGEKLVRSLENPLAPGLRRSFLARVKEVELFSRGGIYLGDTATYHVDLQRLSRVGQRVVRGLFYHESDRRRLRDTYEAVAWCEDGLKEIDPAMRAKLGGYCAAAQSRPPKVIGNDVFRYWFLRAEDDPDVTFWVMVFYGCVGFIGITAPERPPGPRGA
jgi:hypothetical protein